VTVIRDRYVRSALLHRRCEREVQRPFLNYARNSNHPVPARVGTWRTLWKSWWQWSARNKPLLPTARLLDNLDSTNS
jgi:hypothetical protein